jgi:hypothetical protein
MKLDRSKSLLAQALGPLLTSSGVQIQMGLEVRQEDPSRVRFFLEVASPERPDRSPIDETDPQECKIQETPPSQT